MILSILAFIWGYRKGRDTGRNAWLWCIICGFTFIGTQLIVGGASGVFIGFGIAFWGWQDDLFDKLYIPIEIMCIVASIIALLLVFRYLDKVPREPIYSNPPAPPRFDGR